MVSSIQSDPLFIRRSTHGQRVNFVYNKEYGINGTHYPTKESAWYAIPEAHKLSSIYCANAMFARIRSFGLDDKCDISRLSEREKRQICEVEHRRWMISVLILGYTPVNSSARAEWKARRESGIDDIVTKAKKEFKALKAERYIHLDITPFDHLATSEQTKDLLLIENMSYIVNGVEP